MKVKLAALLLALGALCAAPAAALAQTPAPAPAPPAGEVNPVGRFEFNTLVNGQPMKGAITITGAPGAYTGTLVSDMTPEFPISRVTVAGQQLQLVADTPDGPAEIVLDFTGDDFTGRWSLGPQTGDITGKRAAAAPAPAPAP